MVMILKGFFMILSLSARDREALILGIVEELHCKSLALCHFNFKNHFSQKYCLKTLRGYRKVGNAPDCKSGIHRFESGYPLHFNIQVNLIKSGLIKKNSG